MSYFRPYYRPVLPAAYSGDLSYYEQLSKMWKSILDIYDILDSFDPSPTPTPGGNSQFINVKNPGEGLTAAVGDGVTDDTLAISVCISAAGTQGKYVYFPPGRYLTDSFVLSGVKIAGEEKLKSVLLFRGSTGNFIEIGSDAAMLDMSVEGVDTNSTARGINVTGSGNVVNNVDVFGFGYGVYTNNGSYYNIFNDLTVYDCLTCTMTLSGNTAIATNLFLSSGAGVFTLNIGGSQNRVNGIINSNNNAIAWGASNKSNIVDVIIETCVFAFFNWAGEHNVVNISYAEGSAGSQTVYDSIRDSTTNIINLVGEGGMSKHMGLYLSEGSTQIDNLTGLGSFVAPVVNGGSGMTTSPNMIVKLDSVNSANVFVPNPQPGVIGVLPVTSGGSGVTVNPSMLVNLGSTTADTVFESDPRPGVTGILGGANGGLGSAVQAGTWAPTVYTGEGASGSITSSTCMYYKIGRLVFIRFALTINITAAGTGSAVIAGLPFMASDESHISLFLDTAVSIEAGTSGIGRILANNAARILSIYKENGQGDGAPWNIGTGSLSGSGVYLTA